MIRIISTLIFIAFIVLISFNMIMVMQHQRKLYYDYEEENKAKIDRKTRIKRVIILFILLPITMIILFIGNYILNR